MKSLMRIIIIYWMIGLSLTTQHEIQLGLDDIFALPKGSSFDPKALKNMGDNIILELPEEPKYEETETKLGLPQGSRVLGLAMTGTDSLCALFEVSGSLGLVEFEPGSITPPKPEIFAYEKKCGGAVTGTKEGESRVFTLCVDFESESFVLVDKAVKGGAAGQWPVLGFENLTDPTIDTSKLVLVSAEFGGELLVAGAVETRLFVRDEMGTREFRTPAGLGAVTALKLVAFDTVERRVKGVALAGGLLYSFEATGIQTLTDVRMLAEDVAGFDMAENWLLLARFVSNELRFEFLFEEKKVSEVSVPGVTEVKTVRLRQAGSGAVARVKISGWTELIVDRPTGTHRFLPSGQGTLLVDSSRLFVVDPLGRLRVAQLGRIESWKARISSKENGGRVEFSEIELSFAARKSASDRLASTRVAVECAAAALSEGGPGQVLLGCTEGKILALRVVAGRAELQWEVAVPGGGIRGVTLVGSRLALLDGEGRLLAAGVERLRQGDEFRDELNLSRQFNEDCRLLAWGIECLSSGQIFEFSEAPSGALRIVEAPAVAAGIGGSGRVARRLGLDAAIVAEDAASASTLVVAVDGSVLRTPLMQPATVVALEAASDGLHFAAALKDANGRTDVAAFVAAFDVRRRVVGYAGLDRMGCTRPLLASISGDNSLAFACAGDASITMLNLSVPEAKNGSLPPIEAAAAELRNEVQRSGSIVAVEAAAELRGPLKRVAMTGTAELRGRARLVDDEIAGDGSTLPTFINLSNGDTILTSGNSAISAVGSMSLGVGQCEGVETLDGEWSAPVFLCQTGGESLLTDFENLQVSLPISALPSTPRGRVAVLRTVTERLALLVQPRDQSRVRIIWLQPTTVENQRDLVPPAYLVDGRPLLDFLLVFKPKTHTLTGYFAFGGEGRSALMRVSLDLSDPSSSATAFEIDMPNLENFSSIAAGFSRRNSEDIIAFLADGNSVVGLRLPEPVVSTPASTFAHLPLSFSDFTCSAVKRLAVGPRHLGVTCSTGPSDVNFLLFALDEERPRLLQAVGLPELGRLDYSIQDSAFGLAPCGSEAFKVAFVSRDEGLTQLRLATFALGPLGVVLPPGEEPVDLEFTFEFFGAKSLSSKVRISNIPEETSSLFFVILFAAMLASLVAALLFFFHSKKQLDNANRQTQNDDRVAQLA